MTSGQIFLTNGQFHFAALKKKHIGGTAYANWQSVNNCQDSTLSTVLSLTVRNVKTTMYIKKIKSKNLARVLNPRPFRGKTPASFPNQMPSPHHPIPPIRRESDVFLILYPQINFVRQRRVRPFHSAKICGQNVLYSARHLSTEMKPILRPDLSL